MKVLISTSSFGESSNEAILLLQNAGIEIISNPYGRRMTEEEIIKMLDGIDGLLAGLEPLNEKVLSTAKSLRAIARVGIGMSNVDVNAAQKLGIRVSNTPDGPTDAVAEATLTAMLMLSRKFQTLNEDLHNGIWNKQIALGLNGATILIIGYGRIGQRVYEMLKAFKANVIVYDPYVNVDNQVGLIEGLQLADIVSIHASGEEPIITENEFNSMKKGAILLNPSRGALIDEASLISALQMGIVSSAWIDTFWKEPYDGDLIYYPQVLLTPHICTYTNKCRASMELDAAKNLIRDLKEN